MGAREALTLVRHLVMENDADGARHLAELLEPADIIEAAEYDADELLAARRAAIAAGSVRLV